MYLPKEKVAFTGDLFYAGAPYLGDGRPLAGTWKAIALALLGIDASLALWSPDFARLPAYWIWLASIAALAAGFLASGIDAALPRAKKRTAASAIDRGDVPPFVCALLSCTLFWIAVRAIDHAFPPPATLFGATNRRLQIFSSMQANTTPCRAPKL